MVSLRVGVLCGGFGAERDVSFRTADFVASALRTHKHDAQPICVDRDLDRSLREFEPAIAFIALHARLGNEGSVQGVLETLRIPYTGPSVMGCALAGSKPSMKAVLRQHNLPVPPHYLVRTEELSGVARRHGAFGLPVVVKPATAGLSLGVTVVYDVADLEGACYEALRLSEVCLVERYVSGHEVVVALLDGAAVGASAVEVDSASEIWSFAAKAGAQTQEAHVPRLGSEKLAGILRLAERSVDALGLDGTTLCQVIAGSEDVVLGVTSLPPLAPDSALVRTLEQRGLLGPALVMRTLGTARLHGHGARIDRRLLTLPYDGRERRAGLEPH